MQVLCYKKLFSLFSFSGQGLDMVPNLQYLSLNENHLPRLTGLDGTRLLQYLSIKQNNLQEVTEKIMFSL